MRGLIAITFLIVPAMAFSYTGDPNMQPGFSDQGAARIDAGSHVQTNAAVDMFKDMMAALANTSYGSSSSSGVVYEKQASQSLTRKANSKGYTVKDGVDEYNDGKDIAK